MPDDPNDEYIPTALVIENIPSAVKREQMVQLMTDMRLPLPYAFDYHFDNGVFRGLAFANFTTPEETVVAIEHLKHFELSDHELRVNYKRKSPIAERKRIEREKREGRGQFEEQHSNGIAPKRALQAVPTKPKLSYTISEDLTKESTCMKLRLCAIAGKSSVLPSKRFSPTGPSRRR